MTWGPSDALVALISSCQLRRREPLWWARLHFPENLRRRAALMRAFVRLPEDDMQEPDFGF